MKRTKITLEVFQVEVPDEKNPALTRRYYFTSAERPVTFDGQQYVPLNMVDAAKWLEGDVNAD